MKYTTAGNAGFLTTLYVVLVPIVMFIGFRERLSWQTWVAAIVAVTGAALLGCDDHFRLHQGDALEIFGALLWAFHVVVVGHAAKRLDAIAFSVGQFFIAGALNTMIGLTLEADTLPGLAQCWGSVVYVGAFSVAIGYTLQVVGQKHAPASDAAIIMSMEGVFAAIFGYIFLDERLGPRQLAGCLLILAAAIFVQLNGMRESRRTSDNLCENPGNGGPCDL